MAYTLAQYAKLVNDPASKYVIQNLLRDIKVMEKLPFESVNSLKTQALRWRTLPTVAFRDLGSDYTEDTTGDVEPVWESLYILGGLVKFDRVYSMISNVIVDPERLILDMKLKSMAFTFNDYFINGDLASDPIGFQGLKKRISLMPARQKIQAGGTDSGLNGTADAGSANKLWTKIEEAHYRCNVGNVSAGFCNEDLLLGLGRSLRYVNATGGNFYSVTKDSFDRAQTEYRGTPIYDMGVKKDQSTEIITDTELAANGDSTATSLYFASFNMQQGIIGVNVKPIEVIPDAKKDVATAKQTLIEWVLGLAGFGSYGVTRLWSILAPDTWTY